MSKRPFFSIPIATYNRAEDVDFAIKRILAQTFADFEIIVCDDGSTDDTARRVKAYKDKRIRYYKNKKNLGAVKNIGKVLAYVKGRYVFMHGDDDYLLYDNVLEKAYQLIKKYQYGLIRFNYVYQSFDKKNIFDYFRNKFTNTNLTIRSKQKPLNILDFIEKVDLYFISGIVFKNPFPKKITILDSEFIPWFEVCYFTILQLGGYYDSNYNVIASWSHQKKHPVYYVTKDKLPWEELYNKIKKISGESYYKEALGKQLAVSVSFLATIKYNSSNQNLVQYAKRIRELNPAYTTSLKYWVFLFLSIVTPKFVLNFVRFFYIQSVTHRGKIKNYEKLLERVYTVRGFTK